MFETSPGCPGGSRGALSCVLPGWVFTSWVGRVDTLAPHAVDDGVWDLRSRASTPPNPLGANIRCACQGLLRSRPNGTAKGSIPGPHTRGWGHRIGPLPFGGAGGVFPQVRVDPWRIR